MADEMQNTPAQPQTQQPIQNPAKPHRGALVLALGILGIMFCFILGIIAWVMANNDLREMTAGKMDPEGRPLTQAGKICGMISVLIHFAIILIWILMVVIIGIGAATAAAGN